MACGPGKPQAPTARMPDLFFGKPTISGHGHLIAWLSRLGPSNFTLKGHSCDSEPSAAPTVALLWYRHVCPHGELGVGLSTCNFGIACKQMSFDDTCHQAVCGSAHQVVMWELVGGDDGRSMRLPCESQLGRARRPGEKRPQRTRLSVGEPGEEACLGPEWQEPRDLATAPRMFPGAPACCSHTLTCFPS